MGLFSFLKKKKKPVQELPALKVERRGVGFRIAAASQKTYNVKMAMSYEGKPHRQFDVVIKANSRDRAAFLAKEKISIEVLSAVQVKNKRK